MKAAIFHVSHQRLTFEDVAAAKVEFHGAGMPRLLKPGTLFSSLIKPQESNEGFARLNLDAPVRNPLNIGVA